MKILHVIRRPEDRRALDSAKAHFVDHEVTLLLLHDAVLDAIEFPGRIYAARDDLAARGWRRDYSPLSYEGIVALIFANDRVISW